MRNATVENPVPNAPPLNEANSVILNMDEIVRRQQLAQNNIIQSQDVENQKPIHQIDLEYDENDVFTQRIQEHLTNVQVPPSRKRARLNEPINADRPVFNFDYDTLCFFCEKKIKGIIRRIEFLKSLTERKISYHAKCYKNIVWVPKNTSKPNESHSELNEEENFSNIFNHIENSGDFKFTLKELKEIFISQGVGKHPIVFYKALDYSQVCEKWFDNISSLDSIQKKIILSTAADIIKLHVMNFETDNTSYPLPSTFLDHNVITLDGRETFHCLGGIAVYTPEDGVSYEGKTMKLHKMPEASELAEQNQITDVPLENVIFRDVKKLNLLKPAVLPQTYAAYIWGKACKINLPSWKGFNELITGHLEYSTSNIICLPFINAPPSNLTTLNTAIHHAKKECLKLNKKMCFVTFDQPSYYKAKMIVSEKPSLNMVKIRLGGFHLLMSYMGSIGYIMSGSGLEELWTTIYAGESVKKMVTGHAYARSLRAHILTYTAISIHVCKNINLTSDLKESIQHIFGDLQRLRVEDFHNDPTISHLTDLFLEKLKNHSIRSDTAKLWSQYFNLITIMLQFIEAERTGNWKLHLQSIREMLPVFHAAGHFAYAKSAQMYLQDMDELSYQMDDEEYYKLTKEGFFTIRRTDKAWSGVWSDMVIEQTLNRFFGTDLKHGRGVTEGVVARYLLAMPAAFNIMNSLEEYCGLESYSSEQHVDLTNQRMNKDEKHIDMLLYWLDKHDPFTSHGSISSLSTGVIGDARINCHLAVEIGEKGMDKMIGQNASNVTLSAVHKVKPLSIAEGGAHLENEPFINVDPQILFQRIAVTFQGNEKLTREALAYELSPFPLSIFDENGLMRKSTKSELYKLFSSHPQEIVSAINYHVIDGGWLLHKYVWPHSKTYSGICEGYKNYILNSFGENVMVVFDGYNSEIIGTKSYERYRRKEAAVAPDIAVNEEALVSLKQKNFLQNIANKFKFVRMLSNYLNKYNITTKVAEEDADELIVKSAIEIKEQSQKMVAVVGNDVDLFILMIGLAPEATNLYFIKDDGSNKAKKIYATRDYRKFKPYILFAHAFCGCDTTSVFFNIGKKKNFLLF
ncbi:hypothetical protein TKK_0016524 [Trichogramma kaykai]